MGRTLPQACAYTNISQLSGSQIRLHLKTRQPKASDPSIQLEENQPLPMRIKIRSPLPTGFLPCRVWIWISKFTLLKSNADLCLLSYNSRWICKIKQNFFQLLVSMCGNKIPVLCNQENFLLRSNCYKIRQCLPDFHVISKSAIKFNLSYGWPINRIILEMLEHVCVSWMIFFSSSNLPRFTQANCFLKKHMDLSIYRI